MRMSTVSVWFTLTVGLLFSSGLFSALLFGKLTGKEWASALLNPTFTQIVYAASAEETNGSEESIPSIQTETAQNEEVVTAQLNEIPAMERRAAVGTVVGSAYLQHPELPSGCEVTSLAMLLNFSGLKIGKMDLVPIMPRDPTPIRLNSDGSIRYWAILTPDSSAR